MQTDLTEDPAPGSLGPPASPRLASRGTGAIFLAGFSVAILGGLIGLGGAEFRLPLLVGFFGFQALHAVILNKATSLLVVAVSLPLRAKTIPFPMVVERWDVICTLLSGSLMGSWVGAGWATQMRPRAVYQTLTILLVAIAGVLLFGHQDSSVGVPLLSGVLLSVAGVASGLVIGVVAALMGVAGGELLIPTIVVLFGVDIKLAGSISLAVSLPTMLVAFRRYSQDQSFEIIRAERRFLAIMAGGSLCGSYVGGRLLGIAPNEVLLPLLAAILLISARKVWTHVPEEQDLSN